MEAFYDLWFCSLPGIGNTRGGRLLALCGNSTKKVYHAPEKIWKQVLGEKTLENVKRFTEGWKLQEEYEKLAERGMGLVMLFQEAYPERLRHIPDAPLGLFFRGRLPGKERACAAVIGARECSAYGRAVAEALGRALGERGISLVSGMAMGIDGISQRAALAAGGISYGILGCGADICYPACNRELYEMLLEQGGVLSAYPPGTLPRAGNFPPRNRIVSGLADAVVVIEARKKSGTLITVDMALEQGREVYVAPGRITDRLSDGCNHLLKQGAQVFLSPEEFIWEMFGIGEMTEAGHKDAGAKGEGDPADLRERGEQLSLELSQVYGALDLAPRSLEELLEQLPFPCTAGKLGGMLMQLCMKNMAVQAGPGYFCKKYLP